MTSLRSVLQILLGMVVCATALAQAPDRREPIASSSVLSQISMYSYKEGPKSKLEFRPTPLVKNGKGDAEVEYENGNARIDVRVEDLPPPPKLGPYTTYILWALTPDGRASNQGVLGDIDGGKGRLETQHSAPQFALIVTAEPHFAVSAPSDMIVLYNVAEKLKGTETKVTQLTERADYSRLAPITESKAHSADLIAAEYSIAIAAAAGADKYATSQYSTAQQKLSAAENAVQGKGASRRQAPALAREAVLAGEDARREAMNGKVAADAAAERARIEQQAAAERAQVEREGALAAQAAAQDAAQAGAAEGASRANEAARRDLMARLNQALPTEETDRGLVSQIGGVQFATGTANLSASARESLARFAGIVASYPDLKFKIEGHTDSTGSDEINQQLSTKRAIAVRDYLIGQKVPASSIDAEGLASSHPIADNSTNDGRARNRRVEIVITGGPMTAAAQ
ncbi:MAG TPA: OmpA family protein [Candidatus Binatia bacterium]|nr:OmpA family protein [Candidatus Binatia bacterium]